MTRMAKGRLGDRVVYKWEEGSSIPLKFDGHTAMVTDIAGDGTPVIQFDDEPGTWFAEWNELIRIDCQNIPEDWLPWTTALDIQEGGNHYKDFPIQPVVFITRNNLGYCEGNVVKYITRWQKKGGLADLRKARHYIDLLIEMEENE